MKRKLGTFKVAYWRIYLDGPVDLSNFKALLPSALAIYVHEYTHFLIGITTTSGLYYSWNVLDRIRQVLVYAQAQQEMIEIPLIGPAIDEQMTFLKMMEQKVRGNYSINLAVT